jgi:hypothetical protein
VSEGKYNGICKPVVSTTAAEGQEA